MKLVRITKSNNYIFQNAISLGFNDYEDAVQHERASAENLDAIITRNSKDYKNSAITIY